MDVAGLRVNSNPNFRKPYQMWYHMMQRCYNENHPRYAQYGGSGCYVTERWHSFNSFLEDIDKIDGFDYELFIAGKLALDKDKKTRNNKEYSLNNCTFITLEENNKYKPNQQVEIIGTSPEGETFIFTNQSEFARKHGLTQGSISDCVKGKLKTHKKWKFVIR